MLGIILAISSQDALAQGGSELARHARLAQEAIKANNNSVAEAELNAMLQEDPGNADAHANLGMVKFVQGNYLEASRHFEASLSRSPDMWSARAFLGLCKARLGDVVSSRKLLEDSLPHIADRRLRKQSGLELIRSYSDSGMIDTAIPILEKLERSTPDDPEVLYTKYRLHSEMASQAVRKLTITGTNSPWLHEVYGQSYMAQEQYDAAAVEFRKALEGGPQLSGLHYQLGEALLLSERTELKRSASEREFRAELATNAQNADCLLKLGEIALERSKGEEARTLIDEALNVNPDLAAAHVAKSRIFEDAGNLPAAIAELEKAETLAPDVKATYYRLGKLYRRQGRQADADRQLQTFERLALAERGSVSVSNALHEVAQ